MQRTISGMNAGWLRRCWDARYPFYCLGVVVGLAFVWWPYSTQRDLDDWAVQLRKGGVPAEAVVYDRVIKRGGNKSPASETMHLRYDFAGHTRTGEVGCWVVCEPPGTPVRIWINPADPADFVAEFGTLSGNRGRVQAGFGAAGAVLAFLVGMATIGRLSRGRAYRRNRRRKAVPVTHQLASAKLTRRRNRRWRQRKS